MWPQFLPSKPKEKQTTNIKFFTLIEIFQIPHDHLISSNRSLIFWVTWIHPHVALPFSMYENSMFFFPPQQQQVRQVWSGPCATSSAKGYLRHLDNERLKGGADCDVGWVETYRYKTRAQKHPKKSYKHLPTLSQKIQDHPKITVHRRYWSLVVRMWRWCMVVCSWVIFGGGYWLWISLDMHGYTLGVARTLQLWVSNRFILVKGTLY